MAGSHSLARPGGAPAARQDLLGLSEGLRAHDRRVGEVLGVDPLASLVPAHPGRVAEGDVVHVDEYLVLALLVPGLTAV
jgi:hypothetical protein